jgi:TrmH RNA methyltransferase
LRPIVKEKSAGNSRPGIAVVLGNEETGLPDDVKNACSVLLRVPGTGLMDSLNVAQTATLFMQKIFEL